MIERYAVFGAAGLLLEIIYTGACSAFKGNFRFNANTSLWMFFIYGLAALAEPLCDTIKWLPLPARGWIYAAVFFSVEFFTGTLLRRFNLCPWNYSNCRYNVKGVIRLDFAPVWFAAGIVFEFLHFSVLRPN